MELEESSTRENAALLDAIVGPNRSGADPGISAEFSDARAELDKVSSISGGAPDWARVEKLAREILSRIGKDFRVVGWLVVARVHNAGFRGLASGLVLYRDLVATFWDDGFPDVKRVRGRANAYAWVTEQLNLALETRPVTADDGPALKLADTVFATIDERLADKLGEAHPGPGRLRTTLRNLVRAIPEAAPPPPEPPPPSPAAASVPSPVAPPATAGAPPPAPAPSPPVQVTLAAVAPPSDLESLTTSLRQVGQVVRDAAELVRRADLSSPNAYRLQRIGLWLTTDALPPVEENNRTRIRRPAANIVDMMRAHFARGRWSELVEVAEAATNATALWLDPHRMSAVALERLGHAAARDEVTFGVASLLRRLPQLSQLSFSDGMPLADTETVEWIEKTILSSAGGATTNGEAEERDPLEEAREHVAQGRLGDGLASAVAAAHRAPSARARFGVLLEAGKLATSAGAAELARPMLLGLLEEADRHRLDVWEPTLCAELYRATILALRAEPRLNGEKASPEDALFDRLCRLDPKAALNLARPRRPT